MEAICVTRMSGGFLAEATSDERMHKVHGKECMKKKGEGGVWHGLLSLYLRRKPSLMVTEEGGKILGAEK